VEKLCLLLAFNLIWMVPKPVAPAQPGGPVDIATPIIITDPIPPLKQFEKLIEKDSVHKWVTVEINGTLSYEKGLDPSIPRMLEYEEWVGYSISAGDKWFGLDFGDNKELAAKAKKLLGKRVIVKGTVEDRMLGLLPRTIKVMVVSDLAEAAPVKEWIDVQVTGKLEAWATPTPLGGPAYQFVVLVNDKQFLLEIGADSDLSKHALKLDGKRVIVSGQFDQKKDTPTIQAREVKAADDKAKDAIVMNLQGTLIRDAAKDKVRERGNLYRPYHTGWTIHVNGAAFLVEFGGDTKLLDLAAKLDGQTVLLTGSLETVDYFPYELPPRPLEKDEAQPQFIKVPPLRQVQVVRATDLKAVKKDSVQETVHIEIEGKLEHHVLESDPVQHVWLITVDGKTYVLRFSRDVPKEKPERLEGMLVIVTGTLEKGGTVLVTSLAPACRG
jgi:hypothetical protein